MPTTMRPRSSGAGSFPRSTDGVSRIVALLAVCVAVGSAAAIAAQPAPAAIQAEPSDQSAIVTFFNRPIVVLRARALGRGPVERAEAAGHALDDLAARDITGPVEWHAFDTGALITVASRGVLILTAPDVDELSGDTVAEVAARTAERLRQAIGDASAARTPAALLRASAASAAGIVLAALALWGMTRARRAVGQQILEIAERTVARTGLADVETVRASPLPAVERGALTALSILLDLFVIYATVGFVLRQFLYTRPWGQAMGGFLVTTAMNLGLGVAAAVPGLVTAVIIFLLARFVVRLLTLWFSAV